MRKVEKFKMNTSVGKMDGDPTPSPVAVILGGFKSSNDVAQRGPGSDPAIEAGTSEPSEAGQDQVPDAEQPEAPKPE